MMNLIRSGRKMRNRGDNTHNSRHGTENWIDITTIQTQQYTQGGMGGSINENGYDDLIYYGEEWTIATNGSDL